MKGTDIRLFLTVLLLLALAGLGALFLYWIGIDALEGRNGFQFFVDSDTYHAVARGDLSRLEGVGDFVSLGANYAGPVLLLWAVGENYYLVLLLNVAILMYSCASIARSLKLDVLWFTLLLLANPLTISSVLSVNKEIISLLFIALCIRTFTARSGLAFVFAVLVSILVRWQLTLFFLTFCAIASPLNPLRRHRGATVFVLLLGMSVMYVALSSVFESILYNVEMSTSDYQGGSGLFETLTALQNRGGYLLVFPFKAVHLLFAMGLRFDRLIAPENIYNDTWHLLHSTMTLVMFIALCRKGRFSLRDDLVYMTVIYVAIFAISPIYSPRYFYAVYVLWAAALVAPPQLRFLVPAVRAGRRHRRIQLLESQRAADSGGANAVVQGAGP